MKVFASFAMSLCVIGCASSSATQLRLNGVEITESSDDKSALYAVGTLAVVAGLVALGASRESSGIDVNNPEALCSTQPDHPLCQPENSPSVDGAP